MRIVAPDVFFNLGIAFAYFAIPFALYYLIRSFGQTVAPFRAVLWMFTIFILACGMSHLARVCVTLFGGWFYLFDIAACAVTFSASLGTVFLLFKNGREMLALLRELLAVR